MFFGPLPIKWGYVRLHRLLGYSLSQETPEMSEADSTPAGGGETRRNFAWLFHGPSGPTKEEVRRWWEDRQYRYNRDLPLVGVLTWLLVLIAGSAAVKPGVDFEEPPGGS